MADKKITMTGSPMLVIASAGRKGKNMMKSIKRFWKEEDGIGVVELILILVVLIGLVLIFKDSLRSLVETIFETITQGASDVSAD